MSKKSRTKGLLDRVRAFILLSDVKWVTKEGLAERFGARSHEVDHVLHQLNLEGIVDQPKHTRPHSWPGDIKAGAPRCACWCWNRDIYSVRKKHHEL